MNAAAAITKKHGSSFYLASHLIGRPQRDACFTLYAFLRRFDDAVDDGDAEEAVAQGEAFVRALAAGADTRGVAPLLPDDEAEAFTTLVRSTAMSVQPLVDFMAGLRSDLSFVEPHDDHALDLYCDRVAGTVGLMIAWLFGVREVSVLAGAQRLGRAMQLTNILRDVREDLARGRVYLPLVTRERLGVTRDLITVAPTDLRVRALLAHYADRARRDYEAALPAIDAIPGFRERACVSTMAHVYAGILDELEAREFTPAERVRVSNGRRIALATGAVLSTAVWRRAC